MRCRAQRLLAVVGIAAAIHETSKQPSTSNAYSIVDTN